MISIEMNTDALVRLFGDEFIFSIYDQSSVAVNLRGEILAIIYVGYMMHRSRIFVSMGNSQFNSRVWKFTVTKDGLEPNDD